MIWRHLPPAAKIIAILALLSSALLILSRTESKSDTAELWLFSRTHEALYAPSLANWNASHQSPIRSVLLSPVVLERRLQSAFFAGTPAAALVEVERKIVPQMFSGPLEDIGFTDLTKLIREEGIDQMILPASFSPWTSRGRIFGLPHDVHPVLLAYRADLTEAAGIDLPAAETWAEFFEMLRPLQEDVDADGQPDHVPLAFSLTDTTQLEALVLQGGGALFDREGHPMLDSTRNAELLAELVSWVVDPSQRTAEAAEFSASGNRLKLDGFILAALMPDWLTQTWRIDLPALSGKVKLMPLPAWNKGGLRTSVMGGTMLGLPKADPDFPINWEAAKFLYLGRDTARRLFQASGIITPVSAYWSDPVFDEPDPYFCGQKPGRLFIDQAPHTPWRTSSPLNNFALARFADAASRLRDFAKSQHHLDPSTLFPEARRLLTEAQASVLRAQSRNTFLAQ